MRFLIAALLLLLALPVRAEITLGLTVPAWAGFDEGLAAYERGDYATALREWRPLAEQGHAEAQFRLGVMYFNGHGVALDIAEALKWLWKAADQGHARAQDVSGLLVGGLNFAGAQHNLAFLYARGGQGLAQDYAEAAKWYRLAAEQGHAKAQFKLGVMYDNGQGVTQDDAEALQWYRKAAEQGYAKAQYNLGFMYGNGQGVPQDYAQAHMWFNLAASSFPPGEDRDIAVKNRDIVAKKMPPA